MLAREPREGPDQTFVRSIHEMRCPAAGWFIRIVESREPSVVASAVRAPCSPLAVLQLSLPAFEESTTTACITTDRRRIDFTPAPQLLDRTGALITEPRRVEVELGATLAAIEGARAYVEAGAGSVEHFATRLGLAPEGARRYRDAGVALARNSVGADSVTSVMPPSPAQPNS